MPSSAQGLYLALHSGIIHMGCQGSKPIKSAACKTSALPTVLYLWYWVASGPQAIPKTVFKNGSWYGVRVEGTICWRNHMWYWGLKPGLWTLQPYALSPIQIRLFLLFIYFLVLAYIWHCSGIIPRVTPSPILPIILPANKTCPVLGGVFGG